MLGSKMAPPLPCWVLSDSSPSELVWHWLKENNKKREIMRNIFFNMFFQDFLNLYPAWAAEQKGKWR